MDDGSHFPNVERKRSAWVLGFMKCLIPLLASRILTSVKVSPNTPLWFVPRYYWMAPHILKSKVTSNKSTSSRPKLPINMPTSISQVSNHRWMVMVFKKGGNSRMKVLTFAKNNPHFPVRFRPTRLSMPAFGAGLLKVVFDKYCFSNEKGWFL